MYYQLKHARDEFYEAQRHMSLAGLALIQAVAEVADRLARLCDKYGPMNQPLAVSQTRWIADTITVHRIDDDGHRIGDGSPLPVFGLCHAQEDALVSGLVAPIEGAATATGAAEHVCLLFLQDMESGLGDLVLQRAGSPVPDNDPDRLWLLDRDLVGDRVGDRSAP